MLRLKLGVEAGLKAQVKDRARDLHTHALGIPNFLSFKNSFTFVYNRFERCVRPWQSSARRFPRLYG